MAVIWRKVENNKNNFYELKQIIRCIRFDYSKMERREKERKKTNLNEKRPSRSVSEEKWNLKWNYSLSEFKKEKWL